MDLDGRNVVVTGGSRGIGRAVAEEFARRGARVLVAARTTDELVTVAARIGGEMLTVDLTDPAQVDGFVPACLDVLGHIDVFVNNAAASTDDAFVDVDRDHLRALTRLNLETPLLLTRDVARHMMRRGTGHIVQVSSVAGSVPIPGLTAYAATKAGLTHLTESLRVELTGTGVEFTLVVPGPTETELWTRIASSPSRFPRPALRRLRHLFLLPTMTPAEVATATVDAVVHGRRSVRLPRRYRLSLALDEAPRRLMRVAMTGVRLERHAPEPDAFDTATDPDHAGQRAVWIVDDRPSVKWPVYTRANIGDSYPEVVTPLTWSLLGRDAERAWRTAFGRLGLLTPDDLPRNEDMVLLGVFGGYCYVNASVIRMLGVRAPGASVESVDRQYFGAADAPPYRDRTGDRNRDATVKLGTTLLRLLNSTSVPALAEDDRRVETWVASAPGPDADEAELLARLSAFRPMFRELLAVHVEHGLAVALLSSTLADLCAKVDRSDLLPALLGGAAAGAATAPTRALWALSRLDGDGDEFADQFDGFVERFGGRGPNEWELAGDTWGLRPELALAAVARTRTADDTHDPVRRGDEAARASDEAVAVLRGRLRRVDRWQFDRAVDALSLYSRARERTEDALLRALHSTRLTHRELARRLHERGGPDVFRSCLLTFDELRDVVGRSDTMPAELDRTLTEREALHARLAGLVPPFVVDGQVPSVTTWARRTGDGAVLGAGATMAGIGGCPGRATGRARIVLDPERSDGFDPGDVLVAPVTDPAWTSLVTAAAAVVVDVGSTVGHAVVVSREVGVPCVVSAIGATRSIPDGALVEVDGDAGTVTILAVPDVPDLASTPDTRATPGAPPTDAR